MELDKIDFFLLLQKLGDFKSAGLNYIGNMNDPMTSRYWVKRTASYQLYLVVDGEEHLLIDKTHQRSHEEVETEVKKRYTKWFNEFKSGKVTAADLWLKKYSKKHGKAKQPNGINN